jgi:uncharacterized protein (DUF952 family)
MSSSVQLPANAAHLEKVGHTTFHLAPREYWETQSMEAKYLPERFADEGFIHCTDTIEEIVAVGNRYYQGDRRKYLLLEIDCGAVSAPIVYEDSERMFPHIYGPLDVGAVRRVLMVKRDDEGRFLSIAGV